MPNNEMKKVGSWGLSKRFINLIFFLAVYILKKEGKKERKPVVKEEEERIQGKGKNCSGKGKKEKYKEVRKHAGKRTVRKGMRNRDKPIKNMFIKRRGGKG